MNCVEKRWKHKRSQDGVLFLSTFEKNHQIMREKYLKIVACVGYVHSSQTYCCSFLLRKHFNNHGLRIQATNERRTGEGGGHV